jgi:hypothetical protein
VRDHLRLAARKGDRAALTLAVEQMRMLALSPRYWEKYLGLLANPLARLVDLIVIKQGERIAQRKGRRIGAATRRPPKVIARRTPARVVRRPPISSQPSLFPDGEG